MHREIPFADVDGAFAISLIENTCDVYIARINVVHELINIDKLFIVHTFMG